MRVPSVSCGRSRLLNAFPVGIFNSLSIRRIDLCNQIRPCSMEPLAETSKFNKFRAVIKLRFGALIPFPETAGTIIGKGRYVEFKISVHS